MAGLTGMTRITGMTEMTGMGSRETDKIIRGEGGFQNL